MKKIILSLVFITVITVMASAFIQSFDVSATSVSPVTGESLDQEERDNQYMSTLAERSEVSFLEFQPGPFVKADEIIHNYDVALSFVRLHSPFSYYQLTMDEVRECLYDIHPSAVGLDEQIKQMEKMRKALSEASDLTIAPVYFNDEPAVIEAGKMDRVEVPKVLCHAYLNGKPYAVVIRFDAFAGEGQNMKLYQGYMTLLMDDYSYSYYHCSGLTEIK